MPESTSLLSAWAKSRRDDAGNITHWLPLHQHLDDTGAAAGRLVDTWLSEQVLNRIARDLPDGRGGVRVLACWLAAVHDVGKISPAFAVQVPVLADRMRAHGLVASPALAEDPLRSKVTHALVGHCAVRDWLTRELGFARRKEATQLAGIVGSHHGVAPEDGQLSLVSGRPDLAGINTWAQTRTELLHRAVSPRRRGWSLDIDYGNAHVLPAQEGMVPAATARMRHRDRLRQMRHCRPRTATMTANGCQNYPGGQRRQRRGTLTRCRHAEWRLPAPLQGGGQGFDSPPLHNVSPPELSAFLD
jgi:CRISPR-associated endonuclease Cas3-HD